MCLPVVLGGPLELTLQAQQEPEVVQHAGLAALVALVAVQGERGAQVFARVLEVTAPGEDEPEVVQHARLAEAFVPSARRGPVRQDDDAVVEGVQRRPRLVHR
jgi:hypothetical protein